MYYLESYAEGFDKEYTIKDFDTKEVLRLTKDETRELLHSGVKVYRLSLDENDEIIIEKRKGFIFQINTLEDYAILTNKEYLLDEFDAKKSKMQPYSVRYNQKKIAYWKCPQGDSYKMGIRYRTVDGRNCPVCSGNVVVAGVNDLETYCKNNNMEYILDEWDDETNTIKPSEVTKGSNINVHWRCNECGHHWVTSINHRVGRGTNCPNCMRSTSFPEQAILYYLSLSGMNIENRYKLNNKYELDLFISESNLAIEYDGYAWHRDDRDIELDELKNKLCSDLGIFLIRLREDGCPNIEMYDAQRIIVIDLDKSIRELISIVENKIGHKLELDINIQRDRQIILANYKANKRERSIAVTHPQIAKEWHSVRNGNLKPTMFSAGSGERVWWICWYCGTEWQATISNRCLSGEGTNCPSCARERVNNLRHKLTFKSEYPEIEEFWINDFMMDEKTIGTHDIIHIECPKCKFKEDVYLLGARIKIQNGITCRNCNYHVEVQKWNREREEYAERTKNMSDWQLSMTDYYKQISSE